MDRFRVGDVVDCYDGLAVQTILDEEHYSLLKEFFNRTFKITSYGRNWVCPDQYNLCAWMCVDTVTGTRYNLPDIALRLARQSKANKRITNVKDFYGKNSSKNR